MFKKNKKEKMGNFSSAIFTSKNSRGISSIIATLLLIVLTIVLVAVVWGVVNSLVKGKISQSSACFGNFEEIKLSQLYSCYDSNLKQVHVSLNIGNIVVDGVLVSISGQSQTKSFTITNSPQLISNLANYDRTTQVSLPGKNSGATYIYNWSDAVAPNSIQVAPSISGQQCSQSDSISSLESCALL
jgi:flagellin-like protein